MVNEAGGFSIAMFDCQTVNDVLVVIDRDHGPMLVYIVCANIW